MEQKTTVKHDNIKSNQRRERELSESVHEKQEKEEEKKQKNIPNR